MWIRSILWVSVVSVLAVASTTFGVVIGNFEGGLDGWQTQGTAVFSNSPIGVTLGSQSLKMTDPGPGWEMVAKLLLAPYLADYLANKTIEMDVTYDADDWTGATWVQFMLVINSERGGWQEQGRPDTDDVNPGFPSGWDPINFTGRQTRHVTWDISDTHAVLANGGGNWFELFFIANWGGTGSGAYYLDNVRIGTDTRKASTPNPADGQADVPRDAILSWAMGESADAHDVYLGTSLVDVTAAGRTDPRGVLVSQGQEAGTYDTPGLFEFGQTYYWRVDELNVLDSTLFKGNTWSFTAETFSYPVKAIKATASSVSNVLTGPEKTVDGSGLDALDQHSTTGSQMWLSKKNVTPIWIQYEFDDVYMLSQMWVWNSNPLSELDFSVGAKDVTIEVSTDGIAWTALTGVPEFAQAPADANYVHNTTVDFSGVPARYVRLTIHTNWSDETKQAGLSEVRFFSIPVKAYGPTPASGAAGVALDGVLNWRPGREAVRHEVTIGTDPNAVAKGTVPVQTVNEHSLSLGSLALEYNKTYYWKVNEVNDAATPGFWEGAVWSFTTVGYTGVEDFESYNDLCNRIFYTWADGSGVSAPECGGSPIAGNGSGAVVGNSQAPYAERTIVHGGSQSLPLWYDNTRAPYYSETQREWTVPQVWTVGGADTLRVYLRGDAAGFVETSSGTFVMNGTGTDIWDTSDQFRFAYKTLKGNGSIVARVDRVENTNVWAKAGVMIRETLDPSSTHAMVVVTPGSGVSFQRRPLAGDVSVNTDASGLASPYWVKITRTGNTFTAQRSVDGITWVDITAASPVTITMANEVYVGLAVTSHAAGVVCAAKFSNVSTTGGISGSWQVAEIGTSQINGNTPETSYVALQDSTGKIKVFNNPDLATIATGDWEELNIPLSQFTSAGISLSNVKKLIIGVGDRNAQKAGNAGKLYIDDIRLTRVAVP